MTDSNALWDSYKTSEQRAGPLPMASTPRTSKSLRPTPETPNVTNIAVDMELDENIAVENMTQTIHGSCWNCKELHAEVRKLREKVEKQSVFIKTLLKSLNSTSEMDSSESQHGNGSTVSTAKSTRIQRVTPTKRETTVSTSSSISSSQSSPVARNVLQQLPAPRSARTPTGTPVMSRNVRPTANRSTSSGSSTEVQVTQTPPRRVRLPPLLRTPQSLPMGSYHSRRVFAETGRLPQLPPPQASSTPRRLQPRRRLFPESASNPNITQQRETQRSRSPIEMNSNPIEHLNISPVKDDQWARACPPRVHLERNRPEFIERLEARQSIIRAASMKRAEIEQRKRNAARAVATGRTTVESVSRDLFADSTTVRAFYQQDIKEMTLKNLRKTSMFKNKVWERIASVDKVANRIIAQTHSLRARSTSRPRGQY